MVKKSKKDSIITDTSAPPMVLDTEAKDPDVQSNSLLTQEARLHPSVPSDSIVFSMRMKKDLLDHVKQLARKKSYEEKRDISYQSLIAEAVEEKYPMQEKDNEKDGNNK